MKKIFYDRIKLIFLVMANMLKKETQNNDLSNVLGYEKTWLVWGKRLFKFHASVFIF